MDSPIIIHGHFSPHYQALYDAFTANFIERGDVGAAAALVVDGELVVDLWAGTVAPGEAPPWQTDTLANIWSTTKGVTAICFAMLATRGQIDYERAVAEYWPEFAANGKGAVTVAQLLSHQAGLCGFRRPARVEDFYDAHKAAKELAAMEPFWQPGSNAGYHAITIGLLATALFEKVEGRSLRQFVADELADYDISIGLPAIRAHRAATMIAPPHMGTEALMTELTQPQMAALANPPLDPLLPNDPAWRAAEIPSANGFATARGLAQLYGELARGGGNLVSPDVLRTATQVRYDALDAVLGVPARWAAGFLRNVSGIYGESEAAYGHGGWGGSFAFADPDRRIGFAYTMNRMGTDLIGDPRNIALIASI